MVRGDGWPAVRVDQAPRRAGGRSRRVPARPIPECKSGSTRRGVPEPLLQRQLPHPAFPHRCRMRVSQRVRRLVRRADAQPVQAAGEPAGNRLVAQRLAPASTRSADQEQERVLGVEGSLVQHIAVDRVQRAGLVQIDYSLVSGLGSGAARVIVAFADRDSAASIGDVGQLQAQYLPRPQPAVEHQQEDRQIAQCGEAGEQRVDVLACHWPGQPQRQPVPQHAAHRLLPAGATDERLMPIGYPAERVIDSALQRVLTDRVLLGCDRPVEEARRRCQIR